jgi:hypothetical protein
MSESSLEDDLNSSFENGKSYQNFAKQVREGSDVSDDESSIEDDMDNQPNKQPHDGDQDPESESE